MREEFDAYRDSHGFVSTYDDRRTTDNGLRFDSQAMICMVRGGELTDEITDQYLARVRSCYPKGYPGILNRIPVHSKQNEMDDYTAVAAACNEIGGRALDICHEILEAGRKLRYGLPFYMNNERPGTPFQEESLKPNWAAWLGRFPGLTAHLYYSARCEPPWVYRQLWRKIIADSGKPGDQDSFAIPWLMVQSLKKSTLDEKEDREAIAIFLARFKQSYPGGMNELMGDYMQSLYHPLAKYEPKDW